MTALLNKTQRAVVEAFLAKLADLERQYRVLAPTGIAGDLESVFHDLKSRHVARSEKWQDSDAIDACGEFADSLESAISGLRKMAAEP